MSGIIPWIIIAVVILGGIVYYNPEIVEDLKSKNVIQKVHDKTKSTINVVKPTVKERSIKEVSIADITNNGMYVDTGETVRLTGVYTNIILFVPLKKDGPSIKDDQGFYITLENCIGQSRSIKIGSSISVVGQVRNYQYQDLSGNTHDDVYLECSEPLEVI